MSETFSTDAISEEKKDSAEKQTSTQKSDKKPNDSKKTGWFDGMKAEFAKIIWPDKPKIIKNTTAVVLVSIFVAVAVKISDLLIQAVLNLLV